MEFDHFYCDEVEGAGTTIALRDEELRPDCMVLLVFDSYFSVLRSSDQHLYSRLLVIDGMLGPTYKEERLNSISV